MELGTFSLSLVVKDIDISYEFYKKLGFEIFGGDIKQNWIILRNGETVIGLFQGMFEKNIITFNPGWDNKAQNLEEFTDIRVIQNNFKDQGISLLQELEKDSKGPGSIVLEDPDGNTILFDQHR